MLRDLFKATVNHEAEVFMQMKANPDIHLDDDGERMAPL
jgi:hypothetical protein